MTSGLTRASMTAEDNPSVAAPMSNMEKSPELRINHKPMASRHKPAINRPRLPQRSPNRPTIGSVNIVTVGPTAKINPDRASFRWNCAAIWTRQIAGSTPPLANAACVNPTGRQQFFVAPLLMGVVGFLLIGWGRHGELRAES